MNPIPVIIITGFLGCGKTSFLRHLLPVCGEEGKRPALIINEVGEVDVDGELLADLHAEQVRLVGGCVCCTLQSQLTQTIWNVLDSETYDLIIIECSGLSNPIDVVNALSAPALLSRIAVSHIIGLVDAARASKVLSSELARTQIVSSNLVILNKTDTIPDDQKPQVLRHLSELSPNAMHHEAAFGDIGKDVLRKIITTAAPRSCTCGCGHDHHHEHAHAHSLPMSFCTVALNLPHIIDRPNLEHIMASLPENVIRAKGFANVDGEGWQVLHRVYDSVDIYPLPGPAPSTGAMLICIGQHISADAIAKGIRNVILN